MSAGILNEVDNIVEALKPRFYESDLAEAPPVRKLAESVPRASAAVIEAYTAKMHARIAKVVEPLQAGSTVFLKKYDAKLEAAVELAAATRSRSTLASSPSRGVEKVLDKVEVGVGAWLSSLVTMAAVFAGVFFESRRIKRQEAARL